MQVVGREPREAVNNLLGNIIAQRFSARLWIGVIEGQDGDGIDRARRFVIIESGEGDEDDSDQRPARISCAA